MLGRKEPFCNRLVYNIQLIRGRSWIRRSLRSLIVHAELQTYLAKLGLKKVTAEDESYADESYALVA